jgi:hypothetical protein
MSSYDDRRYEAQRMTQRLEQQHMESRLQERRLTENRLADKREFNRLEDRRLDRNREDRRIQDEREERDRADLERRKQQRRDLQRLTPPFRIGGGSAPSSVPSPSNSASGGPTPPPVGAIGEVIQGIGRGLVLGALFSLAVGAIASALNNDATEGKPAKPDASAPDVGVTKP